MNLDFVRPNVCQTTYRVFRRAIHPELFDVVVAGRVTGSSFRGTFGICEAGHVIQVSFGGETVTEVTGPDDSLLPEHGRVAEWRYRTNHEFSKCSEGRIQYFFAGHVEQVDDALFDRLHGELDRDAAEAFLSYRFPSRDRLRSGPLSLLKLEGTAHSITVHAFHTFPDDLAVLRTQSLFEFN